MRRVLLTTDAVGGVWRYSLELAAGFAARGGETVLTVLGPPPDARQCAEAEAIAGLWLVVAEQPLDWTAETPAALNAGAAALADLAVRVGADSVQLHAPALAGAVTWPVPMVVTAHSCVGTWWRAVHGGMLPRDLAWRAAAAERGLVRADAVIAPSASFAADLQACYGLARPVAVIRNGRRPVLGAAARRPVVLTAGRLWDEGKGVATLDAAARSLPFAVYAAGPVSGPNGARAVCPHLRLLGVLDDVALADRYASAAVFASVSRYEPFGLAVLEAAQAGCALVLSDIPTFRELWTGAALFVPPLDAPALAVALERLLRDRGAAERLGALARARSRLYDPVRMAEASWTVHETIVLQKAL
jgi:glycosyltransferase involved in cell wall biosynthesis